MRERHPSSHTKQEDNSSSSSWKPRQPVITRVYNQSWYFGHRSRNRFRTIPWEFVGTFFITGLAITVIIYVSISILDRTHSFPQPYPTLSNSSDPNSNHNNGSSTNSLYVSLRRHRWRIQEERVHEVAERKNEIDEGGNKQVKQRKDENSNKNAQLLAHASNTTDSLVIKSPVSKPPLTWNLSTEDVQSAQSLLQQAKQHALEPLRPIDREQYTIRINTWRRNDQLLVSLNHHSQCAGVAAIQVIWCDVENYPPPDEIMYHKSGKVSIELHTVNSLNERFHILNVTLTPTLGILSIDDDVLRPCEAIDAGFFRWTDHPDRMVGYDARGHTVLPIESPLPNSSSESWAYAYYSTIKKYRKYSLVLTRYSFLHRDYLDLYTQFLPRPIYHYIQEQFNCEDIAMSFFLSALTHSKLPLLSDAWAISTMVKLKSPNKISATKNHKAVRDVCVDKFSTLLGLREKHFDGTPMYQSYKLDDKRTNRWFGVGVDRDNDSLAIREDFVPRRMDLVHLIRSWYKEGKIEANLIRWMTRLRKEASKLGVLDS